MTTRTPVPVIRYKTTRAQLEIDQAPEALRDVLFYLARYAWYFFAQVLTVTRVKEPLANGKPESGVHLAGRAFDIRDEMSDGSRAFTDEEVAELLAVVNARFPRTDGKLTLIHHVVPGSTRHFHAQIPFAWLTAEERKGNATHAPV